MGPSNETGLRKQLRTWRIVVVATLLALLALAGVFGYRQIRAWNHLRAAQTARENQDFVQEREHLLQCLKVWDSNPELYLQAARAARHLRAFDEAEGYLRRFERLNGDAMNGTLEAMLLGINRGDLNADNANVNILDYVRQAPEGHAGAQEILEALSKLYMDSYRLQEARAALTLWAERDAKSAKPLLWRGWVLEQIAAPRFVVADYALALEREPENDG